MPDFRLASVADRDRGQARGVNDVQLAAQLGFGLGRSGLSRVTDRLLGSESNQRRLRWAQTQIEQNGAWIIIVARFIPGGRTATTYIAGTLEMPWKRKFLPADTFAAVVWALFSSALGYIGGATFEKNLWLPILIATGASLLLAGAGELVRRRFFADDGDDAPSDDAVGGDR